MENAAAVGLGCLAALILWTGVVLCWGLMIWSGWNFVVSPLSGWPEMTFWQGVVAGAVLQMIGSFFKSTVEAKA